ncbi:hypothetical protein [Paenibacillus sp. HJGM_3]|uniref:hypothetical protein n=1 Tax=Paenibacillus sp. HJGM_3 TaxID=3379816 RepID=UPI003859E5D3
MKKLRQVAALSLVSSLVLSACGSGSDDPKPTDSAAGGSAATASAKPKLELKWFINAPNNSQLPAADLDFVKQAIDQKFNVDLKIEHMAAGADYTSKMNLKLSSGDTPDMFIATGVDSQKYIQDGVVADMTPYVTQQTMPNYFKYWVTQEELKRYQIEKVFKRAPLPFAKTQYQSYYVRKDWLDKLGLKMPETYEDMLTVMRAFANQDPDGNGKKDTYGYTAAGASTSIPRDFPQFANNGLIAAFMLEGDSFVDVGSDIRIGKSLDDLKKLLAENVVDPDWFVNKAGQQLEKAQQGKVGMVYTGTREFAFDNHPSSIQQKTKEITGVQTVDWQPFNPWAKTGVFSEALPGNPFLFGVKTSPDKIKRSVEILDWLFSQEGYLMTHYGIENKHYKKTGNKIEVIPDAFKKDITDQGSFLNIYGSFTPANDYGLIGLELADSRETDRDRKILEKLKTYKYIPSIGTNVATPAGVNLSDFRKQMNQFHVNIVFDEKDASNWPKYRQEIMTKYGGKQIFESYAEQISAAQGKTYKFKAEN